MMEMPSIKIVGSTAILLEDWHIVVDGMYFVVPEGFESDGASIPGFIQSIFGDSMMMPRLVGAVAHDWLYDSECTFDVTRKTADEVYLSILREVGCCPVRTAIEYSFIRIFGGGHWRKDRY